MNAFHPHPRLYLGPEALARVRQPARDALSKAAAAAVDERARTYLDSTTWDWKPTDGHNAHLMRARHLQTRIFTLLAAWVRSGGEEAYRTAILRHVEQMDRWEDWSWIAWRGGQHAPDATFDLSYGENSATLAVAYDLTAGTLSEAEKAMFRDIADRRALAAFRKFTDPASPIWWMNKPDCNWQPVCAGGGGMLAIAMAGLLPDMETLIARADDAVTRYMQKADEYGGGCVEGLAYWNYGMRYAFMYLLSHEAATGRSHPALALHGSRKTLRFPLDFNPGGVPCGFGDINKAWRPLPFHFAAAARFQDAALAADLEAVLTPDKLSAFDQGWPDVPELLFLRTPAKAARMSKTAGKPVTRLYPRMDWGVIASAPAQPRLAATIRGGNTEGPHNHLDLFSYHLALEGESMVTSISNQKYMDTTFSNRRFDIWEMRPDAKNVVLIGGVGIGKPASVETAPVKAGSATGFRMRGDEAVKISYNGNSIRRLERLFLMQGDALFVVADLVELKAPNQVESRFHTPCGTALAEAGALLTGRKAAMQVAFAATEPIVLKPAMGLQTDPAAAPTNMVRLLTRKLVPRLIMAAVFVPGKGTAAASLSAGTRNQALLTVKSRGKVEKLTLPFPWNPEEPS